MVSRTERQKMCIKRWLAAGGQNSIVAATGFGKTRVALTAIEMLIKSNPDVFVLISVPTEVLKEQWMEELIKWRLFSNCRVEIINSIVKTDWEVDLLVCDECHLLPSNQFRKIFDCVKYKLIMCLTGTMERLDGKEVIIKQYAPVCDTITMDEAIENGWVSPVREYAVMIDADLSEYNDWNQKFNGFFSFFDWDFSTSMACATNIIERRKYAKKMGISEKIVMANAMGFMKAMKARKDFVMSHPKKIEIARKILNARKNHKCITFSATIKDAEKLSFKNEFVLHSKKSKKQNHETIENFNSASIGVLHSSKAADCGVDVKGLSVGIILSTDSSKIRKTQRNGRICRFEDGKTAELFTLLIKGTQEVNWFRNSATTSYQMINEEQLDKILNGEIIEARQRENIENKEYRF